MLEQNKIELIKQKTKKQKKTKKNIFTYLYCHKFMTGLNVRYIMSRAPLI